MSIPMNNLNQGGYAPPGFGAGYPNAPNPGQPMDGYGPPGQPPVNYGFAPGQPQGYAPGQPQGYAPVPQMPPYGEAPYGGQQPPPGHYGPPQQPYNGPGPGGFQPGPQPGPGGFQPGYGAPQGPIITQPGAPMPPGAQAFVSAPAMISGCPPGLECLAVIDQLMVHQKVEILEAMGGGETNNRYAILNALGQTVLFAVEESSWFGRNCCDENRGFEVRVYDNFQREVLHFSRESCTDSIEVSAPPGNLIGCVENNAGSWFTPKFRVKNENNEKILRIEGQLTFGKTKKFDVLPIEGEAIGIIAKKSSGFARELFTDADNFAVAFPMDMDVRLKALLIAATLLIDMMHFES